VGYLDGIRPTQCLQIVGFPLLLIPLPRVVLVARRRNIDKRPNVLWVGGHSCGAMEAMCTAGRCLLLARRLDSQEWLSVVLISERTLFYHTSLTDDETDTLCKGH